MYPECLTLLLSSPSLFYFLDLVFYKWTITWIRNIYRSLFCYEYIWFVVVWTTLLGWLEHLFAFVHRFGVGKTKTALDAGFAYFKPIYKSNKRFCFVPNTLVLHVQHLLGNIMPISFVGQYYAYYAYFTRHIWIIWCSE